MKNIKKIVIKNMVLGALLFISLIFILPSLNHNNHNTHFSNYKDTAYQCGNAINGSGTAVQTSIDFGCSGDSCVAGKTVGYCSKPHNGIIDLVFAIIRFLSNGVGIVVIASIVFGGIQYIASGGDPNSTNKAISRIRSSIVALMIYIFAYAILNYLIPGAFFNQ